MSITRIEPSDVNCRSVEYNGVVYLSGVVAGDKTASMKVQTEQVLTRIDQILANAGTNKNRVLAATVYLADMDLKDDMNEAWIAWADPENLPVRAAVGTKLTPGTLVEIMVAAAK